MESQNNKKDLNSNVGSTKPMAFHIDLNETPVLSTREGNDNVSVCSVCRKGVPAGKRSVTEEQQREWKCFRCLLKNEGCSSSRGGGAVFDINASPPREAEGDYVADQMGGRIQAFPHSSFFNPMNTSVATNSANCGFEDMLQQKLHSDANLVTVRKGSTIDGGLRASHSTRSKYPPQSPNMLYLQTLREYIAERKGVLGEGWLVEFELCDKRFKTSAVYIAPDGSRFESMEDVARHLGFSSSYHDAAKKESSAFVTARNCRLRQSILTGSNSRGFLSGSGFGGCSELSIKELGFSENGNQGDVIHDGFPIQFQDFCLISTGNIDPRPSYHNTNQIWPIGYRCSWHDKIIGSLFVCDVADGGECGPIFKVQRFPCTMRSIPVGSSILSRTNSGPCKGNDRVGLNDSASFQVVDDDSISTVMLLNEHSPPCLDNCVSTSKREDAVYYSQEDNSSNSNLECLPLRAGNSIGGLGLNDIIGEFQVEGRSSSSVWEMVSEAFVYAFHEMYKQKGAVKFFCGHGIYEMNHENLDSSDSLSRYSYWGGPFDIPRLVRNEKEFNVTCEFLLTWLKQDRFGFDVDFVQEIIEQLPGVGACSEYKNLNDRKHNSSLQSVGSGFFQVEQKRNSAFRTSKRSRLQSGDTEEFLMRDPCPPGKLLSAVLPSYLMGDALQAWELAWRFVEVLGLGQSFSFQDLESELVRPWLDSYPLNSGLETVDIGDAAPFRRSDKVSHARAASLGRCSGLLLVEIHGSLLKLLVSELLSKVAVYACPSFDAGESKSRRGRKKDLDCSAALKKTKLDVLPVNELTWHEIARRYILSVLSMEGNLDSTEIASRESGKVFHCLRGDGGILCGSLSGIAALEGDAVVLADAMKKIFGPLKNKNEIVSEFERECDADGAQTIEVKDGVIPEWAQVLEPVRKLPTNVGARIRRCVHEALKKNPPDWAKKMLEHSISKEVYKGNASGPTKRAVVSVLANVSCEIPPQQKVEKKKKVKSKINLSDLIIKQCRIVLRHAAATDEDRVFCNLLGRTILNPNVIDDEGLLGYPAMVSRPLDFRTIDLRLAAGAYCGSHEAFIDDVREVWRNIRIVYGDRSDLIDLAENLSQKFEDLYKKEVLTLVDKIAEFSNVSGSNIDAIKERDDLLADVMKSSLPRAPWDEGICKVCGMDKDDDNVLLCDRCDSEYHRYCLNPPLLKIPKGNWYCPSCVAGQSRCATYGSVAKQRRKNRDQGEFTGKFLEALARLANLMEIKEYWEFTVEERIFFMKFLFDEALNSATIRDHMDQCASRIADLQNKLRSITSELKIQKFNEELLVLSSEKANSGVCNGRGDLKSDASSSLVNVENSSRGKPSDALSQSQYQQLVRDHSQHDNIFAHAQISRGPSWPNESPITIQYQNIDRRNTGIRKDLQGSFLSATQLIPGRNLSGSTGDHVTEHARPAPASSMHESRDMLSTQDNSLKLGTVRNTISDLQDSIASVESELLKVSLRKDYLGRDSNGRVYWVFYWPGARPWIIANGSLASRKSCAAEFFDIPGSDKWLSYESDSEIERLVGWLKETNTREKELKESILQLQSNKPKDPEYAEEHILSKGKSNQLISSVKRKVLSADFLATKAMAALEKKFGPCLVMGDLDVHQNLASRLCQDDTLYRCECLELLWHSKDHCSSCHQSFPTSEELRQHSLENCKASASVTKTSQTTEDFSKCKKFRNVASQEKHPGTAGIHQISTNEKKNGGSSFVERPQQPDCPFKFEEIMARFIAPNSVKDSVMDIGLIGSGGVPSFLPNRCPNLSDPALALGSTRINEASLAEMPSDVRSQQQHSSNEANAMDSVKDNKESNRLSRCSGNGLVEEGYIIERLKSILTSERIQVSTLKDTSSVLGVSKSSIIRESSLRPLVGRAFEILRFLKTNLLDMDAALPEDALRISRSKQDKRCSWRAFVKSARTIYEMVQAIIVLEDTIKSEYLCSDWWYWSSPSTAAKITTISALALRIYALDSAISYEKPLPNGATELLGPKAALYEDAPPDTAGNPCSPPLHKTPESEPTEVPRTRSQTSKRRKDLSG